MPGITPRVTRHGLLYNVSTRLPQKVTSYWMLIMLCSSVSAFLGLMQGLPITFVIGQISALSLAKLFYLFRRPPVFG